MAGEGPIETAYVEIKPRVDPQFAAQIRKEILPALKKISAEAEAAFGKIGTAAKATHGDISSVTRRLNSASKAAERFAATSVAAGTAAGGAFRQAGAHANETGRSVNRMGHEADGAGRRFKLLGYIIRSAMRTAAFAAVGAIAATASYGVKAAAELQRSRVAFEGLLGTAPAADAFIKKLQDFAKQTPFDFEQVAKGSQRLIALGKTGDEAIGILTTVADAAAAVGADQTSINRVVTALAQIQAKGKLSAEEMNQIAESITSFDRDQVVENLAKSFGVTTAKIREMQQKGLIPAKEGLDAVLLSLQQIPGAAGAAARQSATLIGEWSNFKDTVNVSFANALEKALPQLTASLKSLTGVIDDQLQTFGPALSTFLVELGPVVEGLTNMLGPLLTGLFQGLSPLLTSLTPALAPLGEALGTLLAAMGPALVPIAEALVELVPLIVLFTEGLTGMFNILAANPSAVTELAVAFGAVVIVMRSVSGLWIAFSASLVGSTLLTHGLRAALGALAASLGGTVGIALAVVATAFILLWRNSETFRAGVGHMVIYVVERIKFLSTIVFGFLQGFASIAAKALSWVPGLGGQLEQAARDIDRLKDNINASLDRIIKYVEVKIITRQITVSGDEAGREGDFSPSDFNSLGSTFDYLKPKKAAPKRTGGTPKFLPGRSSGGGGGLSKAESAAKKAAAAVKKALVKLADAALAAAKKVADGIKTKLKSAQDLLKKLRDQFADIRDAIAQAFSVDLFSSRSAKQFLKRAERNIKTNTTVLANQQTLQGVLGKQAGGSEFLRQLFESGNTRLIKNLAGQSSTVLADVLAKFNQDNSLANKIGTAVASAFIVGGKPLVVGINNVRDEVIKLQKALIIALAKVEAATKARARLKSAAGGIFNSATDVQVGEAGREVVVPLTRPRAALELLLKSGALGLPTVAAHLGSLENSAQSQSLARLHAMGLPNSPRASSPAPASLSLVPPVKVVKERTLNQTINIHEVGDARLTAASVAARTASHMDR